MLGKADRQMTFSDFWLQGKIPENSFWSILRKWAMENLSDEMFQPLFSYYGRKSISPVYSYTAMLIQLEKGYSDREIEEASRFDDRVKYAMTAPRDFDGIDAMTLCDHRKRLFGSDIGRKILTESVEFAKAAGMFTEENLHVIDAFMVWGANARQDTYTMIYQGIKMLLKVLGFYEMEKKALTVLKRTDYNEKIRKPKINWESNDEKKVLLDELVKDAMALVEHVRGKEKIPEDLKEVTDLLEKVALQDIKMDKGGKAEMVDGTAKDRIISVNDPEMRHGRKTTSKCSDGYKAEIITGGENAAIVMAIEVDGANTSDGEHMADLIDEVKETGNTVDKLYGDSAYGDWSEIEKREHDGMEFRVKVPQSVNTSGGYTKSEFDIDMNAGTITCPEGYIKNFNPEKIENREGTTVKFETDRCNHCPQKEQCTKSKNGRTIHIHPYEDRIEQQRGFQKTTEFKEDYAQRSNGERTISELTKHGGRQGRYKGKQKIMWQLIMVSINNNIKATLRFIYKKLTSDPRGIVCPKTV